MPEWFVQLAGDPGDLETLCRALSAPECGVTKDDQGVYLRSTQFEALSTAGEVHEAANQIVERINSAAAVWEPDFQGVNVNAVITVNEQGNRKASVFGKATATGRARVHAYAYVVSAQGTPKPTGRSDLERSMALQKANQSVTMALDIFRINQTWPGYYKVLEAIQEAVGGPPGIQKMGWATGNEVERFEQSAQTGRHFRYKTPKKRMSLEEGRAFIRDLLAKWIEWEVSNMSRK